MKPRGLFKCEISLMGEILPPKAGPEAGRRDKGKRTLSTVYLGLGTNLGNRERNIERAIEELKQIGLTIEKLSSVIETDPVGGPPQGKFLNAVLKATTTLPPNALLTQLKFIEKKLGRVKTIVNGPRIIDIDILLYDSLHMHTPHLTIPHPKMLDRDFVMMPLKEIEPVFFGDPIHAHN